MMTAIQFDDYCPLQTGKIADIGADGMLAAKLEATKLAPPQMPPKQPFGVCRISAEIAGISQHKTIG